MLIKFILLLGAALLARMFHQIVQRMQSVTWSNSAQDNELYR